MFVPPEFMYVESCVYMCDKSMQLCMTKCMLLCACAVCVHVPLGQYISALAVYCIAGDLSQLAGIQSPGVIASSCGDADVKICFVPYESLQLLSLLSDYSRRS